MVRNGQAYPDTLVGTDSHTTMEVGVAWTRLPGVVQRLSLDGVAHPGVGVRVIG